VLAFVDTDPCYCQARAAAVDRGTVDPQMVDAVEIMRRHDVFFSLGEHLGAADCAIPTVGLRWHATRQPILLDRWAPPTDEPGDAFTTVMSWRIDPPAPIVDGRVYGGKDVEFERFLDLPGRTPERLEVAIAGAAPRDRIRAAGWSVVDAHAISATMAAYQSYIFGSRGELSIAKNAYVASRSGWFISRPQSTSGLPHRSHETAKPKINETAMRATQGRSRLSIRVATMKGDYRRCPPR
jgi:hypothetical protein